MCLPRDYAGHMLFFFENGKAAKVELSAYQTKSNRRRLTGAYSDRSPLAELGFLAEDAEYALFSSDGRVLFFNTAALAPKSTRDTLGVAVMSVKAKKQLVRAIKSADSGITNAARYRARTLPAAGALLRSEDAGEKQLEMELRPEE